MRKISIITICLNEEKTISRTIESVLNQTYSNIEYIIKDGGSSDNSNEIISRYREKLESRNIKFCYLTGKDSGIYDAMNIALKEATGEWVNFMNAGDSFYSPYVLSDLFNNKQWTKCGILYGHTLCELERGYRYVQINNHNRLIDGIGISQQVCFVRKELLDKYPFSKRYKILGDFDFLLKMYSLNVSFINVNLIIANYNRQGVSSRHIYETTMECHEILNQYRKQESFTVKDKFILKIKDYFIKRFPSVSDFLFCVHMSK